MAGSKQQDLRKWSEGCFGLINPLDQFLGAATQGKQNGSVAQVDEIKMKVKRFPTMIKILVCGCQCVTSIWTFWMLTNTIHHPDLSSPPKINNPHFSSLFSFTISFPSLFIQWIGSDPPPPGFGHCIGVYLQAGCWPPATTLWVTQPIVGWQFLTPNHLQCTWKLEH